nr:hypothetical protein [Tanacetum cinerariifolium]
KVKKVKHVARARETVGSSMVQKSGIQCYNCKEHGHVARECQKPKRAKDVAYYREKMLLYAHNVLIELEDMNYDSEQIDQNEEDANLAEERCYNDNLALMLSPESDEVIRLEKESRSKLKRSRVSHIAVQKEKKSFNKQPTLLEKRLDESIPLGKKYKSSLELFNVVTPAITIANGVEMCKKSITKSTYFGYLDPFIKNTIEQNFSPEIEKVLKGLNEFQRCLKEEMVADLRFFNSLEFEVDSLTSQLETQKTQHVNEI